MTTQPTQRIALTLASLALLGACSSPPKPPTVDETQKRPANAQMAIDLQVCKNDLQNTRIQANESNRLAETVPGGDLGRFADDVAAADGVHADLIERAFADQAVAAVLEGFLGELALFEEDLEERLGGAGARHGIGHGHHRWLPEKIPQCKRQHHHQDEWQHRQRDHTRMQAVSHRAPE